MGLFNEVRGKNINKCSIIYLNIFDESNKKGYIRTYVLYYMIWVNICTKVLRFVEICRKLFDELILWR